MKRYSIIQKLFSIKNDGFNKEIRFLGIKITIKNKNKILQNLQSELVYQNNKIEQLGIMIENLSNKFGVENNKGINFNIKNINSLLACFKTCEYVSKNLNTVPTFDNALLLLEFAVANATNVGLNLEFGVYSGRTLNHISKNYPERIFHGFDSFEGLPENWRTDYEKGCFNLDNLPEMNKNVTLIKGWFEDTIPTFLSNTSPNCSFIHVDCDLYSSTKTIFNNLKNTIIPGTIIVFDEYFNYPGWEEHEFKAFQEFVLENKIQYEYIGYVPVSQQVAIRIDTVGKV